MKPSALPQLLDRIRAALTDATFVKLTLSAPRGQDRSLKQVHIRAIDLRGTPHLSFVYRHSSRDITRNFSHDDALTLLADVIGRDFRHAHLFTTTGSLQFEMRDGHGARLREGPPQHTQAPTTQHDQPRQRHVENAAPWLKALGVTRDDGAIARGMEAKFRQIDKFIELFAALSKDAGLDALTEITVADMGCGKGYLTFAMWHWLSRQSHRPTRVRGIELRPELVALGNRLAQELDCPGLTFEAGTIADSDIASPDVLVALHACDTATDDALARGVDAGARLLIVSPCCHKQLRPQLTPPTELADALRHGIFRERQAEFVTDALRAALLEWAGYDTKVFEFISTEHTAKNLMIAATRRIEGPSQTPAAAAAVRALAESYGIRTQRLAEALGFDLHPK